MKGKDSPSNPWLWFVDVDHYHSCGPKGAITYTSEYVADVIPEGHVGGGGTRIFTFKINKSAKPNSYCSIGFAYSSPHELPRRWWASPEKQMRVHIEKEQNDGLYL